ncbi:uncharacterized protein LOC129717566 isoform X2 [Wyeomyia smithii]|uniref:uncharacterized protein LOC129717566 isoform X2 n=1 Tax=Wyeomyia smithii TaxID=174621 RepID=UPI0024680CDD|nr:uncharacterized protein LOC129717566 isoform X2 [Wyeomyia smithii]
MTSKVVVLKQSCGTTVWKMDDEMRRHLVSENSSDTFCRLCFSQIHKLHKLFPPNGQPHHLLVKKIEFCIGICITFSKDSNSCICTKCVGLIEEFFRFKQLCGANEQWTKEYFFNRMIGESPDTSEVTVENNNESDFKSCSPLLTIDTERTNSSCDFNSKISEPQWQTNQKVGTRNAGTRINEW